MKGSAVYKYQYRPFNSNDSSSTFKTTLNSNLPGEIPSKINVVESDSDDDLVLASAISDLKNSSVKKRGRESALNIDIPLKYQKTNFNLIEPGTFSLDDEDESDSTSTNLAREKDDDRKRAAELEVKKLTAQLHCTSKSDTIDTTITNKNKANKGRSPNKQPNTSKVRELLNKMQKCKAAIISLDATTDALISKCAPITVLDMISSIHIPVVKSATERQRELMQISSSSTNKLTNIQSEFQKSSTAHEISGPSVKIKTRLNGSHIWHWKVQCDDSFLKLKLKLAEVYGVNTSELTFEFDGEELEDTETVADREIENDDLIDVKISPNKLTSAIASATSFKTKSESINQTVTTTTNNNIAPAPLSQETIIPSLMSSISTTTTTTTTTIEGISSTPTTAIITPTPITIPKTSVNEVVAVIAVVPKELLHGGDDDDDDESTENDIRATVKAYASSLLEVLLVTVVSRLNLDESWHYYFTMEGSTIELPKSETIQTLGLTDNSVIQLHKREKVPEYFVIIENTISSLTSSISNIKQQQKQQEEQEEPLRIKLIVKPNFLCEIMMNKIASHVNLQLSQLSFTHTSTGKLLQAKRTFGSHHIKSGDTISLTMKK